MPAKIGKPGPSRAAPHAAAASAVHPQQPDQHEGASVAAQQQQAVQSESSTGTLDCRTPPETGQHHGAAAARPWLQALVLEETHVFTEPLARGARDDPAHASLGAFQDRRCDSEGLYSRGSVWDRIGSARGCLADQLQRDSQGDLEAALQSATNGELAARDAPPWLGDIDPDPRQGGPAFNACDQSDSAGLDIVPDTVQKQEPDIPETPADRLHLPASSSKAEALKALRSFVPDSLNEDADLPLKLQQLDSHSKAPRQAEHGGSRRVGYDNSLCLDDLQPRRCFTPLSGANREGYSHTKVLHCCTNLSVFASPATRCWEIATYHICKYTGRSSSLKCGRKSPLRCMTACRPEEGLLGVLQDSQVAPAWLRLKYARQEPVSLADAFFEGADILDDGDTEDGAAADFMCSSPSRSRSEVRLPLSPAWANDASSAPAVAAPRGRARAGEQLTGPASKRRHESMRSPCRLGEAEPDAGMDLEQEINASCAVLGLTALPTVDAVLSPPRRSARLRAPALSPQPSRGTATAAFLSPSKRRGTPERSRGILGQLQDQQEREEDALQRLVTPRKQLHSLGEEAPGSGGVMQALLQQEAMEASALECAVTPKRQHRAAQTPPGKDRRAASEPGTAEAAPGSERRAMPGLMGLDREHLSTLQQLLSPRRPHAPPELAPGSKSRRMQGLLSTADEDAMPALRMLLPGKRQQASQGENNDSRSTLSCGKTSIQTEIQHRAVLDRHTWRLQVVGPGTRSGSGMQHRSCTQLGQACSGKLVWRSMAERGVHPRMSLAFLLGEYSQGLQLGSVESAGLLSKVEDFLHVCPYGRFLQEDRVVLCCRSEGGIDDQVMQEPPDSDAADEDKEEDEGPEGDDNEEAAFHSLRHVKPFAREACRALDAAEAAAAAGGGRHRSSLAAALRR